MKKLLVLVPFFVIYLSLVGCGGEDKNPTSPEPTATPAFQTHTIKYKVTGSGSLTTISNIEYTVNSSGSVVSLTNTALPWELDVTLNTGDGYGLNATDTTVTMPPRDPAVDKVIVEAFKDGATTPFDTATNDNSSIYSTISGTIND